MNLDRPPLVTRTRTIHYVLDREKSSKDIEYLRFFNEQLSLFREITNFNFSFVPADKRFDMLKTSQSLSESEFCKCVQAGPVGKRRCCNEEHLIKLMRKSRKPLVENCHAGLIDVYIPIFVETDFIGYFCFGLCT